MPNRPTWKDRALRLLVLSLVGPSVLLAVFAALPLPARAGICDQVGGVITGDWIISNAQVCTGIFYTVDGSVTVMAGGNLTLVNGGLRFSMDTNHTGYSL